MVYVAYLNSVLYASMMRVLYLDSGLNSCIVDSQYIVCCLLSGVFLKLLWCAVVFIEYRVYIYIYIYIYIHLCVCDKAEIALFFREMLCVYEILSVYVICYTYM